MTIEVPTPSAELLTQLETATIEATETETQAVAALREKFTPYAKHNGNIRIGWTYRGDGSNWREEKDYYFQKEGKRVRGLLASDLFERKHDDQNRGAAVGSRLYLTEHGDWLEITREGNWSNWQGASEGWSCDPHFEDVEGYDTATYSSDRAIKTLTDAEVAADYNFDELLEQIGKSMKDMCEKLTRLKARAELAQRTVEALKS